MDRFQCRATQYATALSLQRYLHRHRTNRKPNSNSHTDPANTNTQAHQSPTAHRHPRKHSRASAYYAHTLSNATSKRDNNPYTKRNTYYTKHNASYTHANAIVESYIDPCSPHRANCAADKRTDQHRNNDRRAANTYAERDSHRTKRLKHHRAGR